MRALCKLREYKTYTSYNLGNAGEDNQTDLSNGGILIPDGESVPGYLEKLYPGRVRCPDDAAIERQHYIRVDIFNHHWMPDYDGLADLLLRVQAHEVVLISDVSDLWNDLESQGLGHHNENCKLQAFCNGLVLERTDGPTIVTMDPKRAARIMSGRAKRANRKTPVKARKRQLKLRDIIDFGVNVRDFVWDKFNLDDIQHSCIGGGYGGGYKTFRAGSWDRAICSLIQVLRFVKHNKVNLNVPKFKNEEETKDKALVGLLAERIKKLRKQQGTETIDCYGRKSSVNNSMDIRTLSTVRRILIQCQS